MCGILLHASRGDGADTYDTGSGISLPEWWEAASSSIAARGPDAFSGTVAISANIAACVSVLGLRGVAVHEQPLHSSDGKLVLLWNGEVFDAKMSGFNYDAHDGLQLLRHIDQEAASDGVETAFARVLGSIEGPYAAVLIDLHSQSVLFARDPLGRRSLLVNVNAKGLSLASVSPSHEFSEVDCVGIWRVSLADNTLVAVARSLTHYPGPAKLIELRQSADPRRSEDSVACFESVLSESVRQRVQHIRLDRPDTEAQVAVLFSGGLDCSTIALLAHRHLPSSKAIDLLNVAFENPRVLKARAAGDTSDPYDVPDRRTSRESLAELQRAAPERCWRLVEVNVTYNEYVGHRSAIEALMAPNTSVMDLSIAAALYFAARARGSHQSSTANVLLSGLGADELLGGYSRHRQAFQLRGREGLISELQMDLDRLPTRNLGRDDRVISSSGKECRYPFLAHAVIHFLADLPVEAKMNLSLEPGLGDKQLLRKLASKLGLPSTSKLTKRAIQFGARSAKMDQGDGRTKGHELLRPRAAAV